MPKEETKTSTTEKLPKSEGRKGKEASSASGKMKKKTKTDKSTEADGRRSGRKRPVVDYNEDRALSLERPDNDDEDGGGKKLKTGSSSSSSSGPKYVPATFPKRQPLPTRNDDGDLIFADHPEFRPNLTPKEVLQLGSFGGTYFRPIYSSVTKVQYDANQWKEFPSDWFEGLNMGKQVTSSTYRTEVNKFGVKCGGDLHMWESSGWITAIDPYGWFQWYCRFYMGRRSEDDARQIARGLQCFGPTGRWRIQLMNKIIAAGADYDDPNISPVIRQTLQHWGYTLTNKHFLSYAKKKMKKMGK